MVTGARMRHSRSGFLALAFLIGTVTAAAPAQAGRAEKARIETRVRALLGAYAANNQAAVLALLDPEAFSIYGSDLSEAVTDAAGLEQMMKDDFQLWGSARFGDISAIDVRQSKDLATAFFHVPFFVGNRPPVIVRVSSVWRKVKGTWLLTQLANTVPTTGSSAHELLKRPSGNR
jgi:hypothetical protein